MHSQLIFIIPLSCGHPRVIKSSCDSPLLAVHCILDADSDVSPRSPRRIRLGGPSIRLQSDSLVSARSQTRTSFFGYLAANDYTALTALVLDALHSLCRQTD